MKMDQLDQILYLHSPTPVQIDGCCLQEIHRAIHHAVCNGSVTRMQIADTLGCHNSPWLRKKIQDLVRLDHLEPVSFHPYEYRIKL